MNQPPSNIQRGRVSPGEAGGAAAGWMGTPAWRRSGGARAAFTLLELMVVIAIIAIIVGLGLPAISKLTKPKGLSVANRQLLDDFGLARSIALSQRATVYVVFAPPNVYDTNVFNPFDYAPADRRPLNELVGGQYSTYALYARRSVGEQPGQEHPRYLTEWKSLPENIFIPWYVFLNPNTYTFGYTNWFRFPTVGSTNAPPHLYYIAFTPHGGLEANVNAEISLAQGSILHQRQPDGSYVQTAGDILETSGQVASGDIVPGFIYQVWAQLSTTGGITYNGQNYTVGQKFTGVAGVSGYTATGSALVKLFEAVELNAITGRGKVVRSEIQ